MRVGAAKVALERPEPIVRLRYVLGALICLWGVSSAVPRMRAAWRLHSVATAFADYALCMVGPTGPSLLRDDATEFRVLLRRRLISALADERPFARCAKGAFEITSSHEVERVHGLPAASFAEYGAIEPGPDTARLDDLAVTTEPLAVLSDAAWPFVRGGYTRLVVPSAYAHEAAHPMEMPRPGIGRGIAPNRSLTKCDTPEGSYEIGLSSDHRALVVRTLAGSGITSDATIAANDVRVFAVSCDQKAAAVAVMHKEARDASLFTCAFLGGCAATPLPTFGNSGLVPAYPFDVARAAGVTVVALSMNGIVRVASSRDDGSTWTPFTVAFDPEAHPELRYDVKTPDRLLVRGREVVLYGAAPRATLTFPMLVSSDFGASWHAPERDSRRRPGSFTPGSLLAFGPRSNLRSR